MSSRLPVLLLALTMAGCGGGGSGATSGPPNTPAPPSGQQPAPAAQLKIDGAVQKGPFLVGSTVLINELTETGAATNSTILSEISDSIGSFSFATTKPGPVQIVASGYYFNELTGQPSGGVLTLRSLYQVTSSPEQHAYVNIMTHLINKRVLKLLSTGQASLAQALNQAQNEFLEAFSYALPIAELEDFSELSIYNAADNSTAGNAYLLALSTAFYKYASLRAAEFGTTPDAELTLGLNVIADDLADDGELQTPGFLDDFVDAVRSLDAVTIISNLRERSIVDYPSGLDVPDISSFLTLCAGVPKCPWRSGAPRPEGVQGGASAAYGGKVYTFGGATLGSPTVRTRILSDVQQYDLQSNQWSTKKPMPIASYRGSAHVIGDYIYVLAGYDIGFMNEVMRYDPNADEWEMKAPRPTYSYLFASAVFDGRIYVMGGAGSLDNTRESTGDALIRDIVEIYDPISDSWSSGIAAPKPFIQAAACATDEAIYVFAYDQVEYFLEPKTLIFTPSAGWSSGTPIDEPLRNFTCTRVGDRFFLMGGSFVSPMLGTSNAVKRYDPATDAWDAPTRLPSPRTDANAERVGEEIVILGGFGDTGLMTSIEIYDTRGN